MGGADLDRLGKRRDAREVAGEIERRIDVGTDRGEELEIDLAAASGNSESQRVACGGCGVTAC
jgi:hypothetical protein